MAISTLWVNQRRVSLSLPPSQRVVDLLRRDLSLVGTKEGCREGDCGACMVLWGRREGARTLYRSVNSCLLPTGEIDGSHILTIEGLSAEGTTAVQKVLEEAGVVQCGFCSPGFVVALTGFLLNSPRLDPSLGREALGGNLCRCTGYASLCRGIEALCSLWDREDFEESGRRGLLARMEWLVARKVLPPWVPSLAQALPELPPPSRLLGSLPVGGATDLLVQREALPSPLFLSRKPSLQGIRRSGEFLSLGGGVNLGELRFSPLVTELFP
ncbi:MAG TPA: 2Fe-2S iron-sulfur cluster-binding protein, partial [Candidatus Aminicenantes bacterium]|nr:2Fe-2S iron-sulfur cluster-binding protein [Candidatus Aminicenantes bacterium]